MTEEYVFIPRSGRIPAKEGKKYLGKKATNIPARVKKQKGGYFLKWDRRTIDYNNLKDKRIRNVRFFGAVFDVKDIWFWCGLKNSWDTDKPENVDFLATMWTVTKQKETDKELVADLTKLQKELWEKKCIDFDSDYDEVLTGEAEQLPDDINMNKKVEAEKLRVTLIVTKRKEKKFANQHDITISEDKFVLGEREDIRFWNPFAKKLEWEGLAHVYVKDFAGEYKR